MTTSTTYPNGQVLVSDAHTPVQMNALFQQLTCGMLGINPPDYSRVRVDWQTQGQPFQNVQFDVCYLSCVPVDVEYSRVRDVQLSGSGSTLIQTWTYTKGWRVSWTLYGPNSEDGARAVRSAMFMDYFNDTLEFNLLYLVNDPAEVTRVPEQFNAQWWERADFHINLYELVTETIQPGVATSVEVKVMDKDGLVADFTANKE